MQNWNTAFGNPNPLGATWDAQHNGFNFAIFSKAATRVQLQLFNSDDPAQAVFTFDFNEFKNKTGPVWHCFLSQDVLANADTYAYRVDGFAAPGNSFNFKKLLLDPWAKAVFFPPDFSRSATKGHTDNIGKAILGQLIKTTSLTHASHASPTHTHDLIIYEMHVKGFTQHASSGVDEMKRGSFSGIIDKIPHLKELGVTAVELMPVHQFDIQEKNYWGYMTLNFFAVHNKYCISKKGEEQVEEFKKLVQAFHDAGIEVILDVIYNHSSEGDEPGPFYSYKGIDKSSYYLLTPDLKNYINDAGTGNVMRTSHKMVRRLVLESLRYYAEEMHVDGFRFDLASIFTRNDDASVNLVNPPILEEISMDPVLSKVRLIAEPWDMVGSQLGTKFPGINWMQWNGQFRDDIRRFVKSDPGLVGALVTRLYGSDDLFPDRAPNSCHPQQSVNFITAHDGFTLYDLVSYNTKHNEANGHNNTDGADGNFSWNCGQEGDSNLSPETMKLRKKQVKNFITLLMLANGTPMFCMGDEFLHTQKGNNNAYNQDNETSWLDWNRKQKFGDIFRFFKLIIAFRKSHPSLCRHEFWKKDVAWHGVNDPVDFNYNSHTVAHFLNGKAIGQSDLYVMINSYWQPLTFNIVASQSTGWKRIVDTAIESDDCIFADIQSAPVFNASYLVQPRSVVVLER